ncbi:MAG: hypothetical protein NC177_14450 [Ruminococcus flavefaciens]|nr:hypothetical protein [Ruminococcus flavefaciens]
MKKFLIILLALTTMCSCGKKEKQSDESSISETTQQETIQPDPYSTKTTAPTETDSAVISDSQTTTATSVQNAEKSSGSTTETVSVTSGTVAEDSQPEDPTQQPDPLGAGAFSYDEDGAVHFTEEPETDNESLMISAGQATFESACRTQWLFTVGCPYEIDTGYVTNNGLGWIFYKVVDENIHSFADVENDYYKVFSERYPSEDLKMLYLEYDNAVYALNGQREMNPYYSMSKITGIESQTEDEIFFTVENYYEGSDTNPDQPYTQEDTFSVVIDGDTIKAGKFTMPY